MHRTQSAIFLILIGTSTTLWANSAGADPRLTGAPGDSNCTSCHSGIVNSGSGSVKIVLPGDATYTPGVKQRITVQISDSAQKRWGFELTARLNSNSSGGQAGSLAAPDAQSQVLCDVTGSKAPCSSASVVQFITQTTAGTRNGTTGGVSFAIDWTPPDTDVGPVTLYVAGNAANGNGTNSGDHIYTNSVQLAAASPASVPAVTGTVSAASGVAGTASASWIVVNGTNLANSSRSWTATEAAVGLPTALDGVSVQVNGKAAYVQSISPGKIIALTPTDGSTGPVNVVVSNNGTLSPATSATMAALAPALLAGSDGKYLVTTRGDNPLADRVDNFPSAPLPTAAGVLVGDVISFYGTGFGPVDPAMADGVLQAAAANLTTVYTMTMGEISVTPTFAGLSPGFAGVYQFKTTVPAGLASGDQRVVIQMGGLSTQSSDTCCFVQVTAVQQRPVITSTVSAASLEVGAAPASWLTINGTSLAASTRTWTNTEAAAGLPITLDGVSVQVNGKAAFVQSVSPSKLVVLTPGDDTVGQIDVQVTVNGLASDTSPVTTAAQSPALFTVDGKYLVTTHGDAPLADRIDNFPAAAWPTPAAAKPGETIAFYGTGFGATDLVIVDGALQVAAANLTTPFTLSIGGAQVTPAFAGLAPGFAGVFQFKLTIPRDMPDGDQAVVIQMNGLTTVRSEACCFVTVKASADASSLRTGVRR